MGSRSKVDFPFEDKCQKYSHNWQNHAAGQITRTDPSPSLLLHLRRSDPDHHEMCASPFIVPFEAQHLGAFFVLPVQMAFPPDISFTLTAYTNLCSTPLALQKIIRQVMDDILQCRHQFRYIPFNCIANYHHSPHISLLNPISICLAS